MTDQQYEKFETKIEDLTRGINELASNVKLLTHRLDRVEDPELVNINNRLNTCEQGIRANDRKIYGAALAIFVLFTFLQFATANGWLTYNTPKQATVKNAN